MKRAAFWSLLLSLLAFALGADEGVAVTHPYVRAMPPETTITAGFMRLHNSAAQEDALLRAESPWTTRIELHEHRHDKGIMRMRMVPQLLLPPGEELQLRPGSYHLMLFGLKKPLQRGQKIPIRLYFRHAPSLSLELPVRNIGAEMP